MSLIRHLVFLRLDGPPSLQQQFLDDMSALTQIEGVVYLKTFNRLSQSGVEESYPLLMDSIMKDKEALEYYFYHPLHYNNIIERYAGKIVGLVVIDYYLDNTFNLQEFIKEQQTEDSTCIRHFTLFQPIQIVREDKQALKQLENRIINSYQQQQQGEKMISSQVGTQGEIADFYPRYVDYSKGFLIAADSTNENSAVMKQLLLDTQDMVDQVFTYTYAVNQLVH